MDYLLLGVFFALCLQIPLVLGQMVIIPPTPSTGVRLFLSEDNTTLFNFSMISENQFGLNNGLWCQSANTGSTIGTWYLPNGAQVPTEVTDLPVHADHATGQVGLLRDILLDDDYQGLYTCIIPDETDINQTIVVAVYTNTQFGASVGPSIDRSSTSFSLLSSRDADPPVFTIGFNVTVRPPTIVMCTLDDIDLNIPDSDIHRVVLSAVHPNILVEVIVILRTREAGDYKCYAEHNIEDPNIGDASETDTITITVPGTPTNLSYMKQGPASAELMWLGPLHSMVTGFEVFYESSNGERQSEETGVGAFQEVTLFLSLQPDQNYTVFVVAYGAYLPSERSNAVTIPQVISFSVSGPEATFTVSQNLTISCEVSILVSNLTVDLSWVDMNNNEVNDTGDIYVDNEQSLNDYVSLDLVIEDIKVSHAGVYTCIATLVDNIGSATINRTHAVNVQTQQPSVTIEIIPVTSGHIYDTGSVSIICSTSITFTNPSVNFSWSGPDGPVQTSGRYFISDTVLDQTYNSSLTISELSFDTDNNTQYSCEVTVGSNALDQVISNSAVGTSEPIILEDIPIPIIVIDAEGIPIVNDDFTLICTGTLEETDLIFTINLSWEYEESDILPENVTVSTNMNESLLSFDPVSTSHEGEYTCLATLNIEGVLEDTEENSTYDFSAFDNPVVTISTTGSNIAGSSYTLICMVVVEDGQPNVIWLNPNGTEVTKTAEITLNSNTTGLTTKLSLQFFSIDYSDIGNYTCRANLSLDDVMFNGITEESIQVKVQIPSPNVSIIQDSVSPVIYQATLLNLTCIVTPNSPLPDNIAVSINWRKNGIELSLNERVSVSRVTNGVVERSTLSFSPLDVLDSDDYNCTGIIKLRGGDDSENALIISNSQTTLYDLTVQELPDPIIELNQTVSGIIGEVYSVLCTADVVDNLFDVIVTIAIRNSTNNTLNSTITGKDSQVSLKLYPLKSSNADQYQCVVIMSQSIIDYKLSQSQSFNISAMFPIPLVVITIDPTDTGTLIEGTYIDIICRTNISESIDTDVNVTVEWSRNGGPPIVNSTNYTINPISLISDSYISVLRVEELSLSDNGANYTCSVTIQPSVQPSYITDNNGMDMISLSVREFTSSDIDVNIDVPSVTTAGDEMISLNCTVRVPERFIYSPDNLTLSYDLVGSDSVAENNSDASESAVTMNGEVFYKTVTFDLVRTSDARIYYCIVTFDSLDVSAIANNSLSVQVPSPQVLITTSPSMEPFYESTALNITCLVKIPEVVNTPYSTSFSWINPSGNRINSTNDGRVTVYPSESVGDNMYQSILVFSPVDNGDNGEFNDIGTYTCQITISTTNNNDLILGTTDNTTQEILITELPSFELNITTSGSTQLSEDFNMTCSVVMVPGLVGDFSIVWKKMDEVISNNQQSNISIVTNVNGPVTNVTLVLSPVKFEHRGIYKCVTEYSSSITNDNITISDEYQLIVSFSSITVTTSMSYSGTLYAGTELSLTCSIQLNDIIDEEVNVLNTWTRNNSAIVSENRIHSVVNRISSSNYSAVLSFTPLDDPTDDGLYLCDITVSPNVNDTYFSNGTANNSIMIGVEELPSPNVVLNITGIPQLGMEYTLNCTANVIDRLIVQPDIQWSKIAVNTSLVEESANDISVIPIYNGNGVILSFNTLKTSDGGQYKCNAVLMVTEINVTVDGSSDEVLQFQIPNPNTDITFTWGPDDLYMECDIVVNDLVDIPVEINVIWEMNFVDPVSGVVKNVLNNDTRITINRIYSTGLNQYRSQLSLSNPRHPGDSTTYFCSVNISPPDGYLYITSSGTSETSVVINITAPSDSPRDFTVSAITTYSLTYQWLPPNMANGPIIHYNLTVDFNNGSESVNIQIEPTGGLVQYILDGLFTYQLITANISASTLEGEGPQAFLIQYTAEDTPGPVVNLSLNILSASEIEVSWSPVLEPNGIIQYYLVTVRLYEGTTVYSSNVSIIDLSVTVTSLGREIPYEVIVVAINGAPVDGIPTEILFFTKEGVPPSPSIVDSTRLNGTHIQVTWERIPLTLSRGFIQTYIISYEKLNRRKRQVMTMSVPADVNSAIISGLDPTALYEVSVAATTAIGTGNFSEGIISNRPNTLMFQVRVGPFESCDDSSEESIKAVIQSAVEDVIIENCECNFDASYISGEIIICSRESGHAVYRANITEYNTFTAGQLLDIIENWVSGSPSVISGTMEVTFDSTCSVTFETNDNICGAFSPSPSVSSTEESPTQRESNNNSGIIIGVVIALVLAVVVVTVVIVIVCVVLLKRKKKWKVSEDITRSGRNNTELNRVLYNTMYGSKEDIFNESAVDNHYVDNESEHTLQNSLYARSNDNGICIEESQYAPLRSEEDGVERVVLNKMYGSTDDIHTVEENEYAELNDFKHRQTHSFDNGNDYDDASSVQRRKTFPINIQQQTITHQSSEYEDASSVRRHSEYEDASSVRRHSEYEDASSVRRHSEYEDASSIRPESQKFPPKLPNVSEYEDASSIRPESQTFPPKLPNVSEYEDASSIQRESQTFLPRPPNGSEYDDAFSIRQRNTENEYEIPSLLRQSTGVKTTDGDQYEDGRSIPLQKAGLVQSEYEIITPSRRTSIASSLVSEYDSIPSHKNISSGSLEIESVYDDICKVPISPSHQDDQKSNLTDVNIQSVDINTGQPIVRPKLKSQPPQSRIHDFRIPTSEKDGLLTNGSFIQSLTLPEIPENRSEDYSNPIDSVISNAKTSGIVRVHAPKSQHSLSKTQKTRSLDFSCDDDTMYSIPFDSTGNKQVPTTKAQTLSYNSRVERPENKQRHHTISTTTKDGSKSRQGIFSRAFKLRKRQASLDSKINESPNEIQKELPEDNENLYETISTSKQATVPYQSAPISDYITPIDFVNNNESPIPSPFNPRRGSTDATIEKITISTPDDIYSDPIDSLSPMRNEGLMKLLPKIYRPRPYEEPLSVNKSPHDIDQPEAVEASTSPLQDRCSLDEPSVPTESEPDKDQPHIVNETAIYSSDNDVPVSIDKDQNIPVEDQDSKQNGSLDDDEHVNAIEEENTATEINISNDGRNSENVRSEDSVNENIKSDDVSNKIVTDKNTTVENVTNDEQGNNEEVQNK